MEDKYLYWRNPTIAEKKFGYGSILYREFEQKYCYNSVGEIHLSIISTDDKRRYFSAQHEYFTTKKYKPGRINPNL